MKRRIITSAVAALVLFVSVPAIAQERIRDEHLVYSIIAFSGVEYARTFAREDADTIYLHADEENFLTVAKTFVYYWPITGAWRTDTSTLNVPLAGTLEVTGPGRMQAELRPAPFTYFNVRGEYEAQWIVAQGDAAFRAYAAYEESIAAYREAVDTYREELTAYEEMFRELTRSVVALRDRGEDVSAVVRMLQEIEPPVEPVYDADYLTPPAPVTEAFIVNLPRGEYEVRLRAPGGEIMQGSERRLVVFGRQRTDGIGVEVIPGDKWTRPVESRTPASVLYVDGSADLYLRPFYQHEYNDLYYEKMRRNDARGNPNIMKWVRVRQIPQAGVLVSRSGDEPRVVREAPYVVEQLAGAALGYRIVPYDPEGAHSRRNPSLVAFRVELTPADSVIELQAGDAAGRTLPGGSRQIRIVRSSGTGPLPVILALLPLAAMAIVRFRRSRVYKG